MPVFEYACESCQNRFEVLVRGAQCEVGCPKCSGQQVRKLFSTFSSPSSSAAAESFCPPGGCGSCAEPGSCMLN